MVQLPPEFVKLVSFHGYFVNVNDRQVYSIKSGILRPLAKQSPNRFNHQLNGWVISHSGRKIQIPYDLVVRICAQHNINPGAVELVAVGERRKRNINR